MEPEYSIFFDRPSVFAKDKEEKILKDIALSLLIKLAQADLLYEGDEDKAEIVNQGVLSILDKYKLNLLIIDKDIMSFIADKAISKFSYYSLTRPGIEVYDYVDALEKEYIYHFTFDKFVIRQMIHKYIQKIVDYMHKFTVVAALNHINKSGMKDSFKNSNFVKLLENEVALEKMLVKVGYSGLD